MSSLDDSMSIAAFLADIYAPLFELSCAWSLSLSFLPHPLSNVGGAINHFYAAGLTGAQKPNHICIHERHFRQVQNKPGSVVLELLFQFLEVLQLKVTNQTNRSRSALRTPFDLQCSVASNQTPTVVLCKWYAKAIH